MPFLDPNAEYEHETRPYKRPLLEFSRLLEEDGYANLPEPIDPLPGPITQVKVTFNEPRVQGEVIYLRAYTSAGDEDLKVELHNVLLRDIFGVLEDDDPDGWDIGERELREKLW